MRPGPRAPLEVRELGRVAKIRSRIFDVADPALSDGQRRRSLRISRAALAPEAPVRPEPGWVPEPHR